MHTSQHESRRVAMFLIESGLPLQLVQQYITEEKTQRAQAREIGQALGVERVHLSFDTGVVLGVYFEPGQSHPDFRRPTRNGVSFPKKRSSWADRLAAQRPRTLTMEAVARQLKIPTELNAEGGYFRMLASPFNPCGFAYVGEQGPYALWAPDVEYEIEQERRQGRKVENLPEGWKLEIPGARRILREEWDLLVTQEKLRRAQLAAAASDQAAAGA